MDHAEVMRLLERADRDINRGPESGDYELRRAEDTLHMLRATIKDVDVWRGDLVDAESLLAKTLPATVGTLALPAAANTPAAEHVPIEIAAEPTFAIEPAAVPAAHTSTAAKGKDRAPTEESQVTKYRAVGVTALPLSDGFSGSSSVASTSALRRRAQVSANTQPILEVHAPADESELTDELHDTLSITITPGRLSALLAMFTFMSLDMIAFAYQLVFRCSPFQDNISRSEFNRRLANLEGVKLFTIKNMKVISSFLLRQGWRLKESQQSLELRLQLRSDQNPVVPAPLLCYSLVTLACMRVEELTGFALSKMFREVTKRELSSLRVATENGVERLDANMMCEMAKQWVYDIKVSVIEGDIVQESLSIAQKCNKIYLERCYRDGVNGAINDADGLVAANMLASNVCFSRLLLGLQPIHLEMLIRFESCLI